MPRLGQGRQGEVWCCLSLLDGLVAAKGLVESRKSKMRPGASLRVTRDFPGKQELARASVIWRGVR